MSGPPARLSTVESQAPRAGTASLVLVRMEASCPDKDSALVPSLHLALVDANEMPRPVAPTASPEGWYSWWLEPGLYCLLAYNKGLGPLAAPRPTSSTGSAGTAASGVRQSFLSVGHHQEDCPELWFEVPAGRSTQYLGSLRWHFKPEARWHGLFGSRTVSWSSQGFDYALEEDLARKQARSLAGWNGSLSTQSLLAGPFGNVADLANARIAYLEGGMPTGLTQPAWVGRGAQRATGLGSPGLPRFHGQRSGAADVVSRGGGGQGGGGELVIAAAMLYAVYLPVGAAVGSAKGKALEQGMEALSRTFTEGLGGMKPCRMLIERFREALPRDGGEPRHDTPEVKCEVSLVRAELVECKPRGTFCLELGARLVWRRSDTGERILERGISSTHPHSYLPGRSPPFDRSYEKVVFASPSHTLDELRGPEGARILAADVPAILKALARGLAEEWTLPAPAPATAAR